MEGYARWGEEGRRGCVDLTDPDAYLCQLLYSNDYAGFKHWYRQVPKSVIQFLH